MDNDAPRLPAAGSYAKRWKAAKTKFKEATGKSKPAPTTKTKVFTEKIGTIEKRHGTGIDKAIVLMEKLLPGGFRSQKGQDKFEQSYFDLEQKISAYIKFLEATVNAAPQDVQPLVWKRAVVALKIEIRRIRLELKAYLDKSKQTEGNKLKAAKTAQDLFQGLGPMITTADQWVGERLRDTAPNAEQYTGVGVTHARNLTQRLMNIQKLPILIGWQADRDRGPVPDEVEDTLEAFANGRRKYADLNEYIERLTEYRTALYDLRQWLGN